MGVILQNDDLVGGIDSALVAKIGSAPLQTQAQDLSGAVNELVNSGGSDVSVTQKVSSGENIASITVDGTTTELYATDTTYSDFAGATSQAGGTHGLVPAPTTSDTDKYLKGDGTWSTVDTGTDVSVTQKVSSGENIASITVDGTTTELYATDTDTWRSIKVNGTQKLDTATSGGAVDFVDGSNTTVTFNSTGNTISITAEDEIVELTGAEYDQLSTAEKNNGKYYHITDRSSTSSVDANVSQTASSNDANYELLFSGTADNTTRTEGARKSSNLTFNPSTGKISTTMVGVSGTPTANTDVATKKYVDDLIDTAITQVIEAGY